MSLLLSYLESLISKTPHSFQSFYKSSHLKITVYTVLTNRHKVMLYLHPHTCQCH